MTLEIVIAIVIGVLLGSILTSLYDFYHFSNAHGILRIDNSDPDKKLYRFEIDDLGDLDDASHVTLKIDHNADLSRG